MYRPTPGPSTSALYQLPPTPPSTPLGGVSSSSLSASYDGMDDVLPALIAFDLDGPKDPVSILLSNDKRLSLYPQVSQILHRLQESQTHIAAISRTSSPEL
ncbi:hypothetical protein FS837_002301 [Tulasnella sp. UAMH 9824]|nr:hypothetical protein FS837_002301 [Tulasnella sp. UAMH 9824]